VRVAFLLNAHSPMWFLERLEQQVSLAGQVNAAFESRRPNGPLQESWGLRTQGPWLSCDYVNGIPRPVAIVDGLSTLW